MRYRLGKDNHILGVGPGWVEFALENGGVDLMPKQILGRSLWDFIAGAQTRHIYKVLFEKVRSHQKVETVDFRCDSPILRRFMTLTIYPRMGSQLELQSRLIREEKRVFSVRLLEQAHSHVSTFLPVCSWCKRVKLDQGVWVEAEAALEKIGPFYGDDLPKLTQGICEECKERILNQLEKESSNE